MNKKNSFSEMLNSTFTVVMFVITMSFMPKTSMAQTVHTCSTCCGYGAVVCPSCYGYGMVNVFNPFYGCYTTQICGHCRGNKAVACGSCSGSGKVVRYNPTFIGKRVTPPNGGSDGYIYQGGNVKVDGKTYKHYKKDGKDYYWNGLRYILYKLVKK